MNRRGFLSALLGSAAFVSLSPLEKLYTYTAVREPEIASFADLNAALKDVYSPGYFEAILEQESAFRRAIRRY